MELKIFHSREAMKGKRRRGISMVECLILLLILGLALEAIVTTMFWASDLGSFNRATLEMHTIASSVFEALEAVPPDDLSGDFAGSFESVIASLGGSGEWLGGYAVAATAGPADNGSRVVTMTVSQTLSKKADYVVKRSINSFSENTTDDVVDN
ncbi:MAG: hypothetical protein LBJ22_02580 [Synergistaceae bacterium]|jgi:type II secretory pathway pseudopilin PulG|nr:hypothetical protein [Synergistaceae bacterium]